MAKGKKRVMSEEERELKAKEKERRAIVKNNMMVETIKDTEAMIVEKFMEEFPRYIEEQKEGFSRELGEFLERYKEVLPDIVMAKKLPTLKIERWLCKPLIRGTTYVDGYKYGAKHIRMASDYYWECVGEMVEKGLNVVPTFQQLAGLLNVSVYTLRNKYLNSEDEEMRETMLMVRDRFVDYYTSRGMKREISEVMSIFMLKAEYNIRDNDVPQTVINNNHYTVGNMTLLNQIEEDAKDLLKDEPIDMSV